MNSRRRPARSQDDVLRKTRAYEAQIDQLLENFFPVVEVPAYLVPRETAMRDSIATAYQSAGYKVSHGFDGRTGPWMTIVSVEESECSEIAPVECAVAERSPLDLAIRHRVRHELRKGGIEVSTVAIAVREGCAVLAGFVRTSDELIDVVERVAAVPGVWEVENAMVVDDQQCGIDRRTAVRVGEILSETPRGDSLDFAVVAGRVFLWGVVPVSAVRDALVSNVRAAPWVWLVVDGTTREPLRPIESEASMTGEVRRSV